VTNRVAEVLDFLSTASFDAQGAHGEHATNGLGHILEACSNALYALSDIGAARSTKPVIVDTLRGKTRTAGGAA
jgi:hypothetical protein